MASEKNERNEIALSSNYSGGCQTPSLDNDALLKMTDAQTALIHGPSLFALKYRAIPCIVNRNPYPTTSTADNVYFHNSSGAVSNLNRGRKWCSKRQQGGMYHSTSVIDFLTKEYKADPDTFVYEWHYDPYENKTLIAIAYIDLGNYLSIYFNGGTLTPTEIDNPNGLQPDQSDQSFYCFSRATVYHVPQTAEHARKLLQQLGNFKIYPRTTASLQMVCRDDRGFYTSSIRIKKPVITDLKLHYGDDFAEIHEELVEILQENDSTGITFLHGQPGTGKTHYLRYLINEIEDKSLIYVPPDMVNNMTEPGFLPFLMEYPNSILIIEDAENIIRDRQRDTNQSNQAVSNLLNLSDGLLGDAMRQQIICTFNCDLTGIDPALLRDGRLVVEHKFDKLNKENARRLCAELGIAGNGEDIHESMSLAEIYTRKNNTLEDMTNGIENGHTTKNKRLSKRKIKNANNFLGFYS